MAKGANQLNFRKYMLFNQYDQVVVVEGPQKGRTGYVVNSVSRAGSVKVKLVNQPHGVFATSTNNIKKVK